MPFQNKSHYTLSLSKDMHLIHSCEFFMSSRRTGRYGDHYRYISVAQDKERQFGNLGLIGTTGSMPIVNVDRNTVTCRLRKDHPLLIALTGIEPKLVDAYARDVGGQTNRLPPVLRPPQRVGHDTLVKFKRLYTVLDPKGEQMFEPSYELTRYLVCVQKITYFNGKPFISLVLKSARISPPSSPPCTMKETPQSLLDMMDQEASSDEGK